MTSPSPSFRGGESRAETKASQDSTYHYIHDSIVVYVPDTIAPSLRGSGESRWHTEWRERVVIKNDTVYQDKETVVQLPPERYIPRAVRFFAWIGAFAVFAILLRLLWRQKARYFV